MNRRERVQAFVDAFNARDREKLATLYSPSARVRRPTWPQEGGVEESLESLEMDFGAYPDGDLSVESFTEGEDRVVLEFRFSGTNTAPLTLFNGEVVPPTGAPIELHGTIVLEFDADGLIAGERQYWEVWPLVELWMRLGVIK